MRVTLCGAAGLAAFGLLALAPMGASAQKGAESGLLGIKLWRPFDDVLKKHGQPTRIEIGMASAGQAGGGGGGMGGGMGAPMSMGSGGGGGGQYGANMGQMMSQRMGGGGKMGGPGMGGGGSSNPYGGGGGGGLPGMPGMGMQGGEGLGGGQSGGMAGGGGGGNNASAGDEGEITWIYEKGPLTNIFLFNKDGRLIQVSSFGYSGGGAVTSYGVRLGDPVGKIYALYGWTSNITKDATRGTMALDYSKDHHVAFQLAEKNKVYHVVGMTVGITELSQLNVFAPGVDFSNARRGMGGMGMMSGGAAGGMGGGMGGPMTMGASGMGGGGMRGRAGGGGGAAMKAGN